MDKTTFIFVAVSILVLIGGTFIFARTQGEHIDEEIILAEKVKGNPEAEVVLSEYSDFQCPACASFQPALNEIIKEYGDQLRLEFNHFPLIAIHPAAEMAARATEAAGVQGKFWEMHDLLFANQVQWSQNINPRNQFVVYAEQLGLDTEAFKRHLNSKVIKEAVQDDMRAGRDLNITGTPSFFLNGEIMEIKTYDDFKSQIEVAIGVKAPEEVTAPAAEVEFSF